MSDRRVTWEQLQQLAAQNNVSIDRTTAPIGVVTIRSRGNVRVYYATVPTEERAR